MVGIGAVGAMVAAPVAAQAGTGPTSTTFNVSGGALSIATPDSANLGTAQHRGHQRLWLARCRHRYRQACIAVTGGLDRQCHVVGLHHRCEQHERDHPGHQRLVHAGGDDRPDRRRRLHAGASTGPTTVTFTVVTGSQSITTPDASRFGPHASATVTATASARHD
jgi:hypothetical protein